MSTTVINALNCTSRRGNTGLGRCDYAMNPNRFAVLIPKGTIILAANLTNWLTYLIGKLTADDPLQRWYALGALKGATTDGEALVKFTYQDRSSIVVADATDAMVYDMLNKLCIAKNLQDFDGCAAEFDVFYVDTKNICKFYQTTDPATGAVAIKGFIMDDFYVPAPDPADYTKPSVPKFRILHNNPKDNTKNMAVIDMKPNVMDTIAAQYAVQNVAVTNVTPGGASAGVFTFALSGGCGTDNLAKLYPTLLANVARYTFKNTATQAGITITSVALNATGDAFVFTLNTADPDYPTPPATIDFNLVAISTLATAGVAYFEMPTVFTFAAS